VNWLFLASYNLNNSTNGSFGFRLFLLAEKRAPADWAAGVNSTLYSLNRPKPVIPAKRSASRNPARFGGK